MFARADCLPSRLWNLLDDVLIGYQTAEAVVPCCIGRHSVYLAPGAVVEDDLPPGKTFACTIVDLAS